MAWYSVLLDAVYQCQFKPLSDHFALDEQAPGYRILQLNADGSHETHVERVLHAQQKINVEISGY